MRPHKPFRFANSQCGKATAAKKAGRTAAANAGGGGGNAAAAPPKAGAGGVAADTKRDREYQRKVAALEKEKANLEKKLKEATSAKSPGNDDEDEFQDANESNEEAEGTKEEWQQEIDEIKGALAHPGRAYLGAVFRFIPLSYRFLTRKGSISISGFILFLSRGLSRVTP